MKKKTQNCLNWNWPENKKMKATSKYDTNYIYKYNKYYNSVIIVYTWYNNSTWCYNKILKHWSIH